MKKHWGSLMITAGLSLLIYELFMTLRIYDRRSWELSVVIGGALLIAGAILRVRGLRAERRGELPRDKGLSWIMGMLLMAFGVLTVIYLVTGETMVMMGYMMLNEVGLIAVLFWNRALRWFRERRPEPAVIVLRCLAALPWAVLAAVTIGAVDYALLQRDSIPDALELLWLAAFFFLWPFFIPGAVMVIADIVRYIKRRRAVRQTI